MLTLLTQVYVSGEGLIRCVVWLQFNES